MSSKSAAMSLKASSVSGISSILKNHAARRKVEQRVRFQVPENVKEVLFDFSVGKNKRDYDELVCTVRGGVYITDGELLKLIRAVRECISELNRKFEQFVEALLTVNWTCRTKEVAVEFQGFILDLLSAHTYYIKPALQKLVAVFKSGGNESEWVTGVPTEKECIMFGYVHGVLKALLRIVPMSSSELIETLAISFPYFKRPAHEQECYIHNILRIIDYQPQMRKDLLFLIVKGLIMMDVNAPRADILEKEEDFDDMDIDEADTFMMGAFDEIKDPVEVHFKMKHPVANCLDVAMKQMFLYIKSECYDSDNTVHWERAKNLYHDIIPVFEESLLRSFATFHAQFLVFYLCSLKTTLAEGFLRFLWRKIINPNVEPSIRQAAVMYIGSFLSRANYVNISLLRTTLSEMATWIHKYITNQDGLESVNSVVRMHAVFYVMCQSLFYVIAFRHRDFVASRKGLAFLQSLNLMKIVTCKLNPLKVCLPVIVQNFAAFTRTYQLAYCYSVLEHNSRKTLPVVSKDNKYNLNAKEFSLVESFFPFDPFILKRCCEYIDPIYVVYQNPELENEVDHDVDVEKPGEMEDEDDFLNDTSQSNKCALSEIFSYSSSPGFKRL